MELVRPLYFAGSWGSLFGSTAVENDAQNFLAVLAGLLRAYAWDCKKFVGRCRGAEDEGAECLVRQDNEGRLFDGFGPLQSPTAQSLHEGGLLGREVGGRINGLLFLLLHFL